ncbi:MAG: DUF2510 domain-containing protein [Actinobacteria bacterium]|uniref:Unannotated protein n=1 Tax=freshwater metagenome TaxID=449393 RepID=A0A6J6BP52_9ZZZZ|nr:DUF2510 domain-containing protein [Actinomycetota bacterium]
MADQNPNTLAAGWYPDTDLVDTERYWDGKSWTNKRRVINVLSESPSHKVINSGSPSGGSKFKPLWQFATGKPGESKGKKALRRIATFVVVMAFFSALGGNTDSSTTDTSSGTESASPSPAVTQSPSSEPTPTESASATTEPSASASASPTPTPMSPTEFRVSALGHISDMRKDFSDFETVLNKGGMLRMLGNIVELEFNIAQLEVLTPPDKYSVRFKEKLTALNLAVDQLSDGVSDPESSVSATREQLRKCRSALSTLESYVKTVN